LDRRRTGVVDEAPLLKCMFGGSKLGNPRRILLQVLQVEARNLTPVFEGQQAQSFVHGLLKDTHNLAKYVLDLPLEVLQKVDVA
jgi:hypothetical protein